MEKKVIDHGPIAFTIGLMIGWIIGYYYPKDSTRWQDFLLGIAIMVGIVITVASFLPGPEKKK